MAGRDIFRSDIATMLQNTLERVCYTQDNGAMDLDQYYDVGSMDGAYVDQMDFQGPGLASEVEEGQEFPGATMQEGIVTRYIARKVGITISMTRETLVDGPSEWRKVINASRHCERSVRLTAMADGASLIANGFSTSYPTADGVAMFSASHTLPNGSLFSNLMATPAAPSFQSLTDAISDIMLMPDYEGFRAGLVPKAIVCPLQQWADWAVALGSKYQPTPGNFAALNVINQDYSNLRVVKLRFWDSTSTQWMILTDAEDGLQFKWRERPSSTTIIDEVRERSTTKRRCRYAYGITNCRGVYGVNA
jgi:hypothetical protein